MAEKMLRTDKHTDGLTHGHTDGWMDGQDEKHICLQPVRGGQFSVTVNYRKSNLIISTHILNMPRVILVQTPSQKKAYR